MLGAYLNYTILMRNKDKSLQNIAKRADIKRETDYYMANGSKITTMEEFLNNDRIFRYAMKAYGLQDMIYAKGMIRKILKDAAYAERVLDPRFKAFRMAFDFVTWGKATMKTSRATKEVVQRYKQTALEEQAGEQNSASRLALYFDRRISELQEDNKLTKGSWAYALLGDKAMHEVIFTAFSIPSSMGHANIDAQARYLEDKMSLKDLTDPARRQKLLQRFLAVWDTKHSATQNAAVTIMKSVLPPKGRGLSNSTLMALQSLKHTV